MLKIPLSISPSQLVELFNSSYPYKPRVESFNKIPYDQCSYRKMYNIIGYGECEDCGWHHGLEGCNVEHDSSICRLNKRLKSAEWQKQISRPRIPVMPKYNIVDGIINSGEYHATIDKESQHETSCKNPAAWDFSPSKYIKETFRDYTGYHFINFADFSGNNSEELYHKLVEDSADRDMSSFETIRLMLGINSGILVLHFPLLVDMTNGKTPLKPYVCYAKEGNGWSEGFFIQYQMRQYMNNYIRKYARDRYSMTPTIHLNDENSIKNSEDKIIGICGKSRVPEVMLSVEKSQNEFDSACQECLDDVKLALKEYEEKMDINKDFEAFTKFKEDHPDLRGLFIVSLPSGSRLEWNFTTNEPLMYHPYIPYIIKSINDFRDIDTNQLHPRRTDRKHRG